jgi:hypothetical protein
MGALSAAPIAARGVAHDIAMQTQSSRYNDLLQPTAPDWIALARRKIERLKRGMPEHMRRDILTEALNNVARDTAYTVCPAPRGAPEWLRRKMHVRLEARYLARNRLAVEENTLARWLFSESLSEHERHMY